MIALLLSPEWIAAEQSDIITAPPGEGRTVFLWPDLHVSYPHPAHEFPARQVVGDQIGVEYDQWEDE